MKEKNDNLIRKLMAYNLSISEVMFLIKFLRSTKFEIYKEIINQFNDDVAVEESIVWIQNPTETKEFTKRDFYLESIFDNEVVSVDDGLTWIDTKHYTKLHNLWYVLNYITFDSFLTFFLNKSFKKIEFPYKVISNGTTE